MGRRPISIFPMTAAERKQRQREREKAKRDQAALAFDRPQEPAPNTVTSQVTKQPSDTVTSNVTISAPLNVRSSITVFDRLICCFCRKPWGAVDHMLIIAGRNAHGVVAVCDACMKDAEDADADGTSAHNVQPPAVVEAEIEPWPFDVSKVFEVGVVGPHGGVTRRGLQVHPLAMAIPAMTERECAMVRESIALYGVKVPLVSFQDKILDGRHRLYFASTLGKPLKIEEFKGTEEEARQLLFSLNSVRTHLSTPLLTRVLRDCE
jgi:hypothetical protein